MAKPTLEQVREFMERDVDVPLPPSPFEIALRMGAALLSAGRYGDDLTAAMEMAWRCVLPFYQGQKAYLENAALMFHLAQHASKAEGDMSASEARAYVTGGETGNMGEAGFDVAPMAVETISAEEIERRTRRGVAIMEGDREMHAADAALHEARASPSKGRVKRVREAQARWDLAAKAQSEAHSL